MHYLCRANYRHGSTESTAVLLVNLGTPQAPTPAAVRRYLAEFLSDPRVIELPRWLWLPLLHGVILPLRSRRSAHAYASVWTEAGSPLMVHSKALAARLQQALAPDGRPLRVELAMRYGQPSIGEALRRLKDAGLRRLLVLPLYPQFSATTTASVFDAVTDELKRWRWQPELRFITDYHREPAWLDAIADSIRQHWARHGRGDRLLFSFHGIPKRYFAAGDPYHCLCQFSAREIADRLELQPQQWQLSFQSRVGREEWLRPYTDETIKALPGQGVRTLDVVCPGFAVDCLETLEEIAVENAEIFCGSGGESLRYIPALNADDAHVQALLPLLRRHGGGWEEFDASPWDGRRQGEQEAQRQARFRRFEQGAPADA
jgi:protoporphyrin/coproporphyrin ferrochelatase